MRFWINTADNHPADAEWFDTLTEAEDAALDWSVELSGQRVQIGTFNLGGPSYIVKEVFAWSKLHLGGDILTPYVCVSAAAVRYTLLPLIRTISTSDRSCLDS